MMIVISFAFMACDGCSGCADNDTAGGESSNAVSYQWSGLKDFNLKITDLDYDYGVTVCTDDGLYYDVTVDDSLVDYEQMGEYKVKFTVGDETKEQVVRIFGLPSMDTSNLSQTFSYAQVVDRDAFEGLFSSVTAFDCFGNSIPVGIEESATLDKLYNMDGTVDYGIHTVNLVAVDASGQLIREPVSFKVKEDLTTKPSFVNSTLQLDVVDEVKSFLINLKSRELMSISINGSTLSSDSVDISDDATTLTLNLKEVDTLELGDNNTIRLATSGGYSDLNVTITDDKPAVMDISGREVQTVLVGDSPIVVQPKKKYEKQEFDIVLNLVSPSGQPVNISGTTFNATEMGTYTLTATAMKGATKRGEVVVKYNAHKPWNTFMADADRLGVKGYRSVLWDDSIVDCAVIDYQENVDVGGIRGDYLSMAIADASYLGFTIPTNATLNEVKSLRDAGVKSVFLNIFFSCEKDKYINGLLISKGCLDADSDGGETITDNEKIGESVWVKAKTWTKISISIDYLINNWNALQNGEMFFLHVYCGGEYDGRENFTVYFSQMIFDIPV